MLFNLLFLNCKKCIPLNTINQCLENGFNNNEILNLTSMEYKNSSYLQAVIIGNAENITLPDSPLIIHITYQYDNSTASDETKPFPFSRRLTAIVPYTYVDSPPKRMQLQNISLISNSDIEFNCDYLYLEESRIDYITIQCDKALIDFDSVIQLKDSINALINVKIGFQFYGELSQSLEITKQEINLLANCRLTFQKSFKIHKLIYSDPTNMIYQEFLLNNSVNYTSSLKFHLSPSVKIHLEKCPDNISFSSIIYHDYHLDFNLWKLSANRISYYDNLFLDVDDDFKELYFYSTSHQLYFEQNSLSPIRCSFFFQIPNKCDMMFFVDDPNTINNPWSDTIVTIDNPYNDDIFIDTNYSIPIYFNSNQTWLACSYNASIFLNNTLRNHSFNLVVFTDFLLSDISLSDESLIFHSPFFPDVSFSNYLSMFIVTNWSTSSNPIHIISLVDNLKIDNSITLYFTGSEGFVAFKGSWFLAEEQNLSLECNYGPIHVIVGTETLPLFNSDTNVYYVPSSSITLCYCPSETNSMFCAEHCSRVEGEETMISSYEELESYISKSMYNIYNIYLTPGCGIINIDFSNFNNRLDKVFISSTNVQIFGQPPFPFNEINFDPPKNLSNYFFGFSGVKVNLKGNFVVDTLFLRFSEFVNNQYELNVTRQFITDLNSLHGQYTIDTESISLWNLTKPNIQGEYVTTSIINNNEHIDITFSDFFSPVNIFVNDSTLFTQDIPWKKPESIHIGDETNYFDNTFLSKEFQSIYFPSDVPFSLYNLTFFSPNNIELELYRPVTINFLGDCQNIKLTTFIDGPFYFSGNFLAELKFDQTSLYLISDKNNLDFTNEILSKYNFSYSITVDFIEPLIANNTIINFTNYCTSISIRDNNTKINDQFNISYGYTLIHFHIKTTKYLSLYFNNNDIKKIKPIFDLYDDQSDNITINISAIETNSNFPIAITFNHKDTPLFFNSSEKANSLVFDTAKNVRFSVYSKSRLNFTDKCLYVDYGDKKPKEKCEQKLFPDQAITSTVIQDNERSDSIFYVSNTKSDFMQHFSLTDNLTVYSIDQEPQFVKLILNNINEAFPGSFNNIKINPIDLSLDAVHNHLKIIGFSNLSLYQTNFSVTPYDESADDYARFEIMANYLESDIYSISSAIFGGGGISVNNFITTEDDFKLIQVAKNTLIINTNTFQSNSTIHPYKSAMIYIHENPKSNIILSHSNEESISYYFTIRIDKNCVAELYFDESWTKHNETVKKYIKLDGEGTFQLKGSNNRIPSITIGELVHVSYSIVPATSTSKKIDSLDIVIIIVCVTLVVVLGLVTFVICYQKKKSLLIISTTSAEIQETDDAPLQVSLLS